MKSRKWPGAYREASELLGKSADHLDGLAKIPLNTLTFDAFSCWPAIGLFHSISAFGLLGLASSSREVDVFLFNAKKSLARDGVLFGASWVFSSNYAKQLGMRGQHISGLSSRFFSAGFKDVRSKFVSLKSRCNYTGIVLFQGRN